MIMSPQKQNNLTWLYRFIILGGITFIGNFTYRTYVTISEDHEYVKNLNVNKAENIIKFKEIDATLRDHTNQLNMIPYLYVQRRK